MPQIPVIQIFPQQQNSSFSTCENKGNFQSKSFYLTSRSEVVNEWEKRGRGRNSPFSRVDYNFFSHESGIFAGLVLFVFGFVLSVLVLLWTKVNIFLIFGMAKLPICGKKLHSLLHKDDSINSADLKNRRKTIVSNNKDNKQHQYKQLTTITQVPNNSNSNVNM